MPLFENICKRVVSTSEDILGRDTVDKGKMALIRPFVQEQLSGIGELVDLQLDSQQKRLAAELKLEGEEKNISLVIDKYELEQRVSGLHFIIQKLSISKPWLNVLAQKVLPLAVPIPEKHADAVRFMM